MASRGEGDAPFSVRDLVWAGLLAAATAVLYLLFPTKAYVFEGLARAMPIEVGRFRSLFNGNYLLYGLLGWAFHGLLGLLGAPLLSVTALQIMDSLLGAAGLGLLFLLLRLLGAGRPAAASWAAVLGSCLAYWSWSVDAQDYILSTFLLELNFFFLVLHAWSGGKRVRPEALGLLHALAVTGHIVNGLFGAVNLWFLYAVHGRAWRRPAARYLAAAAGGVLAAYGLTLALVVRPESPARALTWFIGSLATSGGGARWHGDRGYGLAALATWARMSLNILASYAPEFRAPPGEPWAPACLWAARALLALLVLRLAAAARGLKGLSRTVAAGCAVWLCAYALVFTSWEPYTMVYRVSDLVPIVVLLFLGATGPWRAAGPVLALLLGLGNFGAEIRPKSFATNNPHLERMAFLKENTREGDWVVTAGGGAEELYIPFFAERRPIQLGAYERRPEDLSRLLGTLLGAGQSVYVTSRALEDKVWRRYFEGYRPVETAASPAGFILYRLRIQSKSPARKSGSSNI